MRASDLLHVHAWRVVLVALPALIGAAPSQAGPAMENQALSLTGSHSRQHFNGMAGYGLGWRGRGNSRIGDVPIWWSADTSLWLRDARRSWRVTVGPLLSRTISGAGLQLEIEGAVRVTYIEHPAFGSEDLGSHLHFASHAGLAWWSPEHRFALGFRFEHVSNAGLTEHNPGVNFASFELRLPILSRGTIYDPGPLSRTPRRT